MAKNVDGKIYTFGEASWHGDDVVSMENDTAVEALGKIGGGYFFEKRYVKTFLNGQETELDDRFTIVRSASPHDPVERVFDVMGKDYNIVQPLDIAYTFDERVGLPVDTLGFLGNGERMFITWKQEEFEVKKGDLIKPRGFVAAGFNRVLGLRLSQVEERVVCENTFLAAFREGGVVWSGRHNSPNLLRDLGAWMSHIKGESDRQLDYMKRFFNAMANYSMDKKEAQEILYGNVYPSKSIPVDYPEELLNEKVDQVEKSIEFSERSVDGVMDLFGGNGIAIDATAWGLFNSVTEYENHHRAVRKDPENSILFGARGQAMNRMAMALVERVNL